MIVQNGTAFAGSPVCIVVGVTGAVPVFAPVSKGGAHRLRLSAEIAVPVYRSDGQRKEMKNWIH